MIAIFALCVDALLGEPKVVWDRIPHPAVLMGRLIGKLDKRFNTGPARRAKGTAVAVALLFGAACLGLFIGVFGTFFEVLVVAILLAQRSLSDHVWDVAKALRRSLGEGRASVAMIVGRNTASMDQAAVTRAAIESAAENFSDGVIAPLFWYLVAGLPGILVYKCLNTADSMIGYRTPRHEAFGWAAARLDDLANWIPARLSAALIMISHGTWRDICEDARKHRSPNAGWPEAAMAQVLDLALAGPRSYEGEMTDFPWVNDRGRGYGHPRDIERAVFALWRAWGLTLTILMLGTALL